MLNLHGGTVLGVATTATLNIVGATYLHDTGQHILSLLFISVMFVSTLLTVATFVRFFRNQRRFDMHAIVEGAKAEWLEAHKRLAATPETSI